MTTASVDDVHAGAHTPRRISRLLYWGNGSESQLGHGDVENVSVPTALPQFDGRALRSLSSGFRHTALAADEGVCYTFGLNNDGELGHTKRRTRPEPVDALEAFAIVQVAAGKHHTAAVSQDGQLLTWGASERGQLGLGLAAMSRNNGALAKWGRPHVVRALAGHSIAQVAAGDNHMLALGTDGTVWAWGDNTEGQLGIGTFAAAHTPTEVTHLRGVPIVRVACGASHSLALSAGGDVYAWGSNLFGQLGLGDVEKKLRPALVEGLDGKQAIDIACGADHSAVITGAGRLVTFGAGSNGQLGHGTDTHEHLPRTVVELMGVPTTRVACGRRHTLVYQAQTNALYAFGLGGSGQLGNGSFRSSNLPTPVKLPPGAIVTDIWAGADQSFAAALAPASGSDTAADSMDAVSAPLPLVLCRASPGGPPTLAHLTPAILAELVRGRRERLEQHLSTVFSSSACLSASFFLPSFGRPDMPPEQLAAVRDTFAQLWALDDSPRIAATIGSATSKLLTSLSIAHDYSFARPDTVRVFAVLLENPLLLAPDRFFVVLAKLATVLAGLRGASRAWLGAWLGAAGAASLGRAVHVFQGLLSHAILNPDHGLDLAVPNCVHVLAWLHAVNAANGAPLPTRAFYNSTITERVDMLKDYETAVFSPAAFSFTGAPFLLEPVVKEVIFHHAVRARMEVLAQRAVLLRLAGKESANPFLALTVRRDHIFADAVAQLDAIDAANGGSGGGPVDDELHKPLIVRFAGEEAQDDGGVRKEFFHLLVKEVTQQPSRFFAYDDETRLLWFGGGRGGGAVAEREWERLGELIGLAVANACLVDLQFPTFFYKKLLGSGAPPTLDDLAELQPAVARSLRHLLGESDESAVADMGLYFVYDALVDGRVASVEVKPGGAEIPVTAANRAEYVQCVVRHLLVDGVKAKFEPLRRGLLRVCDGPMLRLFAPSEAELLVRGTPTYHFHELEKVTHYANGYAADHPTIRRFWQVFHALPTDLKQKFLVFVSGSDRVPLGGWQRFRLTIQRTGDPRSLPAAHTCFNLLDLPDYPTVAELQDKLVYALQNTEGFGLV